MKSAASYLMNGDASIVELVIEKVLQSETTRWYRPDSTAAEGQNLDDFFSNSEEYSPGKDSRRFDEFKRALTEIAGVEGKKFAFAGEKFAYDALEIDHLRRVMPRVKADDIALCYCHGDFNSNNIFISAEKRGVALIDFEYSGKDHVYKDFVSFESSLRTEYLLQDRVPLSFSELVAMEVDYLTKFGVAGEAVSVPYLTQIDRVRCAASSRYGDQSSLLYSTALGFHSVKLLGLSSLDGERAKQHLPPVWNREQKKRLCAAVFAASLVARSHV